MCDRKLSNEENQRRRDALFAAFAEAANQRPLKSSPQCLREASLRTRATP